MMVRRLLLELALFLAPFVLFALYRLALGRADWLSIRERKAAPVLFFAGIALSILGFIGQAMWEEGSQRAPDEKFIAARYEDGKLVPGYWVDEQGQPVDKAGKERGATKGTDQGQGK